MGKNRRSATKYIITDMYAKPSGRQRGDREVGEGELKKIYI